MSQERVLKRDEHLDVGTVRVPVPTVEEDELIEVVQTMSQELLRNRVEEQVKPFLQR